MTKQIQVGELNRLRIERESDYGLFLCDESGESVLLPNRYVTEQMHIGEETDVFVYNDSEDRLVAPTERPLAKRGEFALMKVTDIVSFGAFVDWGLPKELLVPRKMQKHPLEKGKSYIIYVAYDAGTDRLVGDTHIGHYLRNNPKEMQSLREVDLLIVARTPMGYKVIADNRYEGMLFHNEIYEKISIGDRKEGYVKKIRDDGKLDLTLQPPGKAKEEIAVRKVRDALKEAETNTLPFTYKSDAEAIQKRFGISKKAWKKALTQLLDADEITLHEEHISLKKRS